MTDFKPEKYRDQREVSDLRAEKRRIRREMEEVRKKMMPARREAASRIITERVLALPALQMARTVMAFVGMAGEPDTREILSAVLREGKQLLLPRCLDEKRMIALPVTDLNRLRPGRFGIPEPGLPDAYKESFIDETERPEPDLILIPCVAATEAGARLGHGAGYYDRFLEARKGFRVGLCFRACILDSLPEEETDRRLDLVIHDGGEWTHGI